MKVKYLVGAVIETVIKVVALVVIIMYVYRAALGAYEFGYLVFAEEPVSRSGGRIITVAITGDFTVKGVGEMLEEKGLIRDANLFIVQELLSEYRGKLQPGIYDLSTAMTTTEMMETMSAAAEEEEE